MRYYVLFASSFRSDATPCISHETIDKEKTLCGRKVSDAETFEPDNNNLEPDCRKCAAALARLRSRAPAQEEAQLKCERCASDHGIYELRKPCGAVGCECWCNR
jgi:hypothetical protein